MFACMTTCKCSLFFLGTEHFFWVNQKPFLLSVCPRQEGNVWAYSWKSKPAIGFFCFSDVQCLSFVWVDADIWRLLCSSVCTLISGFVNISAAVCSSCYVDFCSFSWPCLIRSTVHLFCYASVTWPRAGLAFGCIWVEFSMFVLVPCSLKPARDLDSKHKPELE